MTKVPTAPPNVSINENMAQARRRGDPSDQDIIEAGIRYARENGY